MDVSKTGKWKLETRKREFGIGTETHLLAWVTDTPDVSIFQFPFSSF